MSIGQLDAYQDAYQDAILHPGLDTEREAMFGAQVHSVPGPWRRQWPGYGGLGLT